MHVVTRTAGALTLVLTIFVAPFTVIAQEMDEKKALLEADGKWLAISKDAAAFIGYTDPEFKFFPPNAPLMTDKSVAQEHWDKVINTPGLTLVWAPEGAEVAESGDLGFTYGFYQLTTTDESGKETENQGKYLTVMRKQASGEWRPLIDMFSANQ